MKETEGQRRDEGLKRVAVDARQVPTASGVSGSTSAHLPRWQYSTAAALRSSHNFKLPSRLAGSSLCMNLQFFTCDKCGKVCKSARGLSQHSSIHRRPIQLGNATRGSRCEYHPLLNGNYYFSIYLSSPCSCILKGYPVIIVAIFSRRRHRRHQHHQS